MQRGCQLQEKKVLFFLVFELAFFNFLLKKKTHFFVVVFRFEMRAHLLVALYAAILFACLGVTHAFPRAVPTLHALGTGHTYCIPSFPDGFGGASAIPELDICKRGELGDCVFETHLPAFDTRPACPPDSIIHCVLLRPFEDVVTSWPDSGLPLLPFQDLLDRYIKFALAWEGKAPFCAVSADFDWSFTKGIIELNDKFDNDHYVSKDKEKNRVNTKK